MRALAKEHRIMRRNVGACDEQPHVAAAAGAGHDEVGCKISRMYEKLSNSF